MFMEINLKMVKCSIPVALMDSIRLEITIGAQALFQPPCFVNFEYKSKSRYQNNQNKEES